MRHKLFGAVLGLLLMSGFAGTAMAQYSFSGDAAVVSKYIWRGQRLTNDWSLQPSMTLSAGDFSFNTWATMDLTAVNESPLLLIKENPASTSDNQSGLQGQFTEVDYTFSYGHSFDQVSVEGGTIFYTFPERSYWYPTTTEIYGSVSFDTVPGTPSATLYVDVDETGECTLCSTGVYFLIGGGHSIETGNDMFPSVDFSGTISFANSGFSEFYYGPTMSGAHDASVSVSAPIDFGNGLSASGFVTYSALLRDFRDYQFQDPRELYIAAGGGPAASTPNSLADTVWAGFSFSLSFDN